MASVTVIIAAAGSGQRMGLGYNKLLKKICDRPLLSWTIEAFEKCRAVDNIIITAAECDIENILEILHRENFKKVKKIVRGGKTRTESIKAAIDSIEKTDIVAIHDGARPFVSQKAIKNVLTDAEKNGAAILAVRVTDTIKSGEEFAEQTLDREKLWAVQTPQAFKFDIIKEAYDSDKTATDDAALVEKLGIKVKITEGEYQNIKITTLHDLLVAEALLEKR